MAKKFEEIPGIELMENVRSGSENETIATRTFKLNGEKYYSFSKKGSFSSILLSIVERKRYKKEKDNKYRL